MTTQQQSNQQSANEGTGEGLTHVKQSPSHLAVSPTISQSAIQRRDVRPLPEGRPIRPGGLSSPLARPIVGHDGDRPISASGLTLSLNNPLPANRPISPARPNSSEQDIDTLIGYLD